MTSGKKAKRLLALEAKSKSKARVGSKRAGEGPERTSRARAKTVDERLKKGTRRGVGQGEDRHRGHCTGPASSGSVGSIGAVGRGDTGDLSFKGDPLGEGSSGRGTGKGKGRGSSRDHRINDPDSSRLELLYAPFKEVGEVFDWLEESAPRSVNGIIRSLLETNHRYNKQSAASSSGVVDKMKEKTLLLENPTGQKASRSNRHGMFYAPPGVRMASRRVLKGFDGGKLSYEDALVLHELWRGYRDEVMGEPTANKREEMERVWGLERCGAMVEVVWPSALGEKEGEREGEREEEAAAARVGVKVEPPVVRRRVVQGIVIKDSATSMHVVEKGGAVRVVDKRSGCAICMQVSHGQVARFW